MAEANLHIPQMIKVNVRVTGVREMRFRIWAGGLLIRLAAKLMGGVGRIEVDRAPDNGRASE